MNKAEKQAVCSVVEECEANGVRTVTVYMSKRHVVRATNNIRPRKGGKRYMTLTIGKPNYAERQYIARCERNGYNVPSATPICTLYPVKKK